MRRRPLQDVRKDLVSVLGSRLDFLFYIYDDDADGSFLYFIEENLPTTNTNPRTKGAKPELPGTEGARSEQPRWGEAKSARPTDGDNTGPTPEREYSTHGRILVPLLPRVD